MQFALCLKFMFSFLLTNQNLHKINKTKDASNKRTETFQDIPRVDIKIIGKKGEDATFLPSTLKDRKGEKEKVHIEMPKLICSRQKIKLSSYHARLITEAKFLNYTRFHTCYEAKACTWIPSTLPAFPSSIKSFRSLTSTLEMAGLSWIQFALNAGPLFTLLKQVLQE